MPTKAGETRRLVAVTGGDGDLVTALGAAAVQDGLAGLGGHTNEKAVDLGTTAAVGLERALGHDVYPVCENNIEKSAVSKSCEAVMS